MGAQCSVQRIKPEMSGVRAVLINDLGLQKSIPALSNEGRGAVAAAGKVRLWKWNGNEQTDVVDGSIAVFDEYGERIAVGKGKCAYIYRISDGNKLVNKSSVCGSNSQVKQCALQKGRDGLLRLAIGWENRGIKKVHVYIERNEKWEQVGQIIYGRGNSVAWTKNYLVVASGRGGSGELRAATMFTFRHGAWSMQGSPFVDAEVATSLSSDAVVEATERGIRVHDLDEVKGWVSRKAVVAPWLVQGKVSDFSMGADGNVVLLSVESSTQSHCQLYVFNPRSEQWQSAFITPGASVVALSADGKFAACGAKIFGVQGLPTTTTPSQKCTEEQVKSLEKDLQVKSAALELACKLLPEKNRKVLCHSD